MTIEDHVKAIAATMSTPPTVFWGAIYEHNIALDDAQLSTNFPVILMYPPIVKVDIREYGMVLNEYVVVLSFIDKIAHAEKQNTVSVATIKAMRALAFEFISKAKDYVDGLGAQKETVRDALLHSLDPTKKLDTDMFFDQYDLNVAGYGLTISIPILEKIKECA
jgi:hypothetical protein